MQDCDEESVDIYSGLGDTPTHTTGTGLDTVHEDYRSIHIHINTGYYPYYTSYRTFNLVLRTV